MPDDPATILTPDCPLCGQPPIKMMGGGTQAFCGNDDCRLLTWDPTKSAEGNLANASEVGWEPTKGGSDE